MSPSDPHSSLAALRQLKEMLDAGTITPEEFEALKRQVVFGAEPALPIAPPAEAAGNVASPVAPEAPAPEPEATIAAYDTVAPNPSELPPASPDWLAAAAPSLLAADEQADLPPLEERRNPLNLVFAIGGLLVFLGVVAYLMIGRPAQPNEHLSSGTQTAADSAAVVPEVGPQAEQLNLPPATAPDTVRVAPQTPPAPAPAASQFRADSAATPASVPAPAPSAPAGKAPVVAPTTTTTTTMSTDSAASKKP